jgi:hypothetical protein
MVVAIRKNPLKLWTKSRWGYAPLLLFQASLVAICLLLVAGTGVGASPFMVLNRDTDSLILNLEGNPGGHTYSWVTAGDGAMIDYGDYFGVVANPEKKHIWVNAIASSKYVDTLPDGSPISPGVYGASLRTRLPILPLADGDQEQNPQNACFSIGLYDGTGKFGSGAHIRLEATLIWVLNPWDQECYRLEVLQAGGKRVDIGITIPHDSEWHTIQFEADFNSKKVTSVTADGRTVRCSVDLYETYSYDWQDVTAIWASVESCSAFPGRDCDRVFWWQQDYQDFIWWMGSAVPLTGYTTSLLNSD